MARTTFANLPDGLQSLALFDANFTDCASLASSNIFAGLNTFTSAVNVGSNVAIQVGTLLTINGNITTLPSVPTQTLLQLGATNGSNSFIYHDAFGVSGSHNSTPHIVFRTNRGTITSPSAVGAAIDNTPTLLGSTGDYFGALFGLGYQNGGAYESIAPTALAFRPTQLQTASAQGSRVQIAITPNGSATGYYAFTFDQSGTLIVNNTVTVAPPTPVLGVSLTPLQLVGATGNQGIEMDSAGGANFLFGSRADGTPAARTAVAGGAGTLQLGGIAYDGASNNTVASIDFFTLNLQSVSDHSGYIRFRTTPSGTTGLLEAMRIQGSGGVTICASTAIPAGGTAGAGVMVSTTANFGVFFGSGVPTLVAAKGSLYLRSDGLSSGTRLYMATDSAGTWTNVLCAT